MSTSRYEPRSPSLASGLDPLEEQRRLILFLQGKKAVPEHCPNCNVRDWQVSYRIDVPVSGRSAELLPVIPVSCKNCGYTMFFNAVIAGIIRPPTTGTIGQPTGISP
jgi:predicted nucleic-acid-binding Zn-ribbon protein